MTDHHLTKISTHVYFLIMQICIVVACFFFVDHYYKKNILPDKLLSQQFSVTRCYLTNKQLVLQGSYFKRYRADFFVTISVKGKLYFTHVSGNGLDQSFTPNERAEQILLDQYQVKNTYPCWYDPELPTRVVLVQRNRWFDFFPFAIPFLIGSIMLYYAYKNIRTIRKINAQNQVNRYHA